MSTSRVSSSSALQWYFFACVPWHRQAVAINRRAKALHVGVQLGAVTDVPAERGDVLQPFLPSQRVRAPSTGAGFRPKQALPSAPAGIGRLTVSVRL